MSTVQDTTHKKYSPLQKPDLDTMMETLRLCDPQTYDTIHKLLHAKPHKKAQIARIVHKYLVQMMSIARYYNNQSARIGGEVLNAMDTNQSHEMMKSIVEYTKELHSLADIAAQKRDDIDE